MTFVVSHQRSGCLGSGFTRHISPKNKQYHFQSNSWLSDLLLRLTVVSLLEHWRSLDNVLFIWSFDVWVDTQFLWYLNRMLSPFSDLYFAISKCNKAFRSLLFSIKLLGRVTVAAINLSSPSQWLICGLFSNKQLVPSILA